ncbi:WD40 containing snare-dependent exocytosis protein [Pluteus cervinus]|uniref:WD40 containing snare-dependent exocytosis protein n=1 Tax=Pluteus cervinus TaxID=181527 RepID=A0ACD3BI19_9AGAR|nr:WD40 containing snare-dependent exocytosis protein [Pluteus cervinus]
MFSRRKAVVPDLSAEVRDPEDWNVIQLRAFEYSDQVTTIDIDPVNGLLAVGSGHGTVHIFGGPPVHLTLKVPHQTRIKAIHFAMHTKKLVCLDDRDCLHIWDLDTPDQPLYLIAKQFDPLICITLSPSHSHVFLALASGDIQTYDLVCLRKSPYTVSSPWAQHAAKMIASGVYEANDPNLNILVDLIIHPRDLKTLLIAYSGGIVIFDLEQRTISRVFELVIPAGAPGGVGYGDKNLFTHRKPSVTALAVHPAGHFFAAGYSDGCIAFWAFEDDDVPILVKTLSDLDVNIVDGSLLEDKLASLSKDLATQISSPEPIFKLSWCGFSNSVDPRSGETAMIIMGGTSQSDTPSGLTVERLAAFNPLDIGQNPGATGLHPHFRAAMRKSCEPLRTYVYDTLDIIQDYCVVPQQNPHLSGCFDPSSIVVLTEPSTHLRVVQAYQFPPPEFERTVGGEPSGQIQTDFEDSLTEQLNSTLDELQLDEGPQRLLLPDLLLQGARGVMGGHLINLDKETYSNLTSPRATQPTLQLTGGISRNSEEQSAESKHAKYQPPRILLTYAKDMSVQISDLSSQLLLGTPTLTRAFPEPCPHLCVDLQAVLADSHVVGKTSGTILEHAEIEDVQFAKEAMEMAVALRTGEVVLYRLNAPEGLPEIREVPDREIVILNHIGALPETSYSPYFMVFARRGPIQAFALSDVGFFAVAYPDGSLFIVNMRVPNVIFRLLPNDGTGKRHSSLANVGRSGPPDPFNSLVWTGCHLSQDAHSRIRLVALSLSGKAYVFTLQRNPDNSTWSVEHPLPPCEGVAEPLCHGAFVIDAKKGHIMPANRDHLRAALEANSAAGDDCILVVAGAKGARAFLNINGDRVGRVEWGAKVGPIASVQIVERMGSRALVAFTNQQTALCYSLPQLEYLHTLQLPSSSTRPPSIDETGDFILWDADPGSGRISEVHYGALFGFRRACPIPDVELIDPNGSIPPQPQPVAMGPTSLLGSLFKFSQGSLSGMQIDELLGGPDRQEHLAAIRQKENISAKGPAVEAKKSAAGLSATVSDVQNSLYNTLTAAMNERGQKLGDLEERLNDLEEGSKSMVTQAKRLAAQQSAKGWFGF